MRILHVIQGLQAVAGTSTFCGELVREQVKVGHCVGMMKITIGIEYPIPSECQVMGFSIRSLIRFKPDVVHLHTTWYWKLSLMAIVAKLNGARVIWSPHGALMPWALKQSALKKRLALLCYLGYALRLTDRIHATSQDEKEAVGHFVSSSKVFLAPLGVTLSPTVDYSDKKNVVLFCSRIHPSKGVEDLIRAWANVKAKDWKLVIAGPESNATPGYLKQMRELAESLHVADSVSFPGQVRGKDKDELYLTSSLFVLPSYSENFGGVVLEALAAGTPVIVAKGAPWREVEEEGCGWWIDLGVDSLTLAMRTSMQMDKEQLHKMGKKGHEWVAREYAWNKVAAIVEKEYKEET